jgi:Flp pilus assembly protein TadD
MIDTEAFAEFRKALGYLRDSYPEKALPHFRRATELEDQNPFYRSYMGLALARTGHGLAEAEDLCNSALRAKRDQPQLYLNLAEVYVASSRRQDAVETLLMATKYSQRDGRIYSMLNQLSSRRAPVLRFLQRNHFLNRGLGIWRHRALRLLEGQTTATAA